MVRAAAGPEAAFAALRRIMEVRRDVDILKKILAHVAAIIGLYLAFSFALFLGLQVNPAYGNIGLVAVAVLVALYAYVGFIRKRPRPVASRSER